MFSYFRIPKALFQDIRFRQLSTDARTLYGILLDRMSLSVKNGWLDEQGRVYIIYTVREVQESLCCAEHKAVKLFRELEQLDLIERKRRGLGRPSLIYVKDFSSGLPKAQVQNCPNSNSGAAESAVLEQPKPQANKTDKNKTEWNDPDPIYSEGIREQLEDYFYQAVEVELLLRLCPDEEDTIYQIVDLLVDTCSTKRKMLRIAGDDKPAEVVRSRLKKLNADHIRFVMDSLAENTAPVRNMKQYLLAMLYTEEELAELRAQKEQEERQRMEKQRKREKAYREKRKAKKIAENGGEVIKTKTCPHCGKVFTPTSNRQLFCSRECWNQARQEQKKADREAERGTHYYRQRTCAVCGHSYWPTHSQQEFCSDECRRINHNRKTLEFYHKKKGNPKPDPEAVPTPKPKEDNAA